ncbi:MAG: hypothetical protein EPO26_07725 [Chloroflexota bacterium]|nr:MAG: hypothetical protein EPO26_07725 [Chloroflexota bacterium]
MQLAGDHLAIAQALLAFGRTIPVEKLFPTDVPEAASFVLSDPFAFTLAACLNRQTPAETIWAIPYELRERLGHLDPWRVRTLAIDDLAREFAQLRRKPRFVNDAPRTIAELTTIVCDEYGGDASRLWVGRRAADVRHSFLRIHGVGDGIASLIVLLIEKAFGLRFPDLDRPRMDIKPDRHAGRVLCRLGVSSSQEVRDVVAAGRVLHPYFPGELDAPLWLVGREYCHSELPRCVGCPVTAVCARVGVASQSIGLPAPSAERTSAIPTAEPPTLSVERLGGMRRSLHRLFDQLDPDSVGSRESISARLSRLRDRRRIPRDIAALMRSVIETRNTAEYETLVMLPSQSRAVRATWQAIDEWTRGEGPRLDSVE